MENSLFKEVANEVFASAPPNPPVSLPQNFAAVSRAFHLEHLKRQYEHLLVLQEYHTHQMNAAQDQERFESYCEIVNAIVSLCNQFEVLLAKLQSE